MLRDRERHPEVGYPDFSNCSYTKVKVLIILELPVGYAEREREPHAKPPTPDTVLNCISASRGRTRKTRTARCMQKRQFETQNGPFPLLVIVVDLGFLVSSNSSHSVEGGGRVQNNPVGQRPHTPIAEPSWRIPPSPRDGRMERQGTRHRPGGHQP